jgi:L-ascorbate metabolism protein UlaG (beta-lactamase superfamily)
MLRPWRVAVLVALLFAAGCRGFFFSTPEPVPNRIRQPRRDDARLAVLWVGHATMLVQLDDRFVLTDPLLTDSAGQVSRRLHEPGIDPADLPVLDAVLISHLHFDHLSLGSLDEIEDKVRHLIVPHGGLVYVPNYAFDARELSTWSTFDDRGLRITSVPVAHSGYRYGVDAAWMTDSFTGYVIEYHGMTVYFAGDTAYDASRFTAAAARFPRIDLALMPIAPIHPRDIMESRHVDPAEAIRAFLDLRATRMIPMHYETLVNGFDEPGEARASLEREVAARGLAESVIILPIGGQAVVIGK